MRQQIVIVQRQFDFQRQEGDNAQCKEENDQHGTVPAEIARFRREVLHDQLRIIDGAIWIGSLITL